MRKAIALILVILMFVLTACTGGQQKNPGSSVGGMVIENGMAQQIASYTDPMSLDYTNDGSELLRFVVYVVPFCGFSTSQFSNEVYTPEEMAEMKIDPASVVPFTHDYSFTVDCGLCSVSIPVTSE